MDKSSVDDAWRAGVDYEQFMGRWSRPVAKQFLAWLAPEIGSSWLDVGCGTGSLTEAILADWQPAEATGVDYSEPFVAHARRLYANTTARFRVGSATALPFPKQRFDYAVSGLALNFFPDQRVAVREMKRVVRPSGVVAIYVWDYADKMEMLRLFWDSAVQLDPTARSLDEAQRFPVCQPDVLQNLLAKTGLIKVAVTQLDTQARFANFDAYWAPFLGKTGPAPGYVASLHDKQQDALAKALREGLPVAVDGSITLKMRAWAIKGINP